MSGQPFSLAIAGIARGLGWVRALLAAFRQGKEEWTPTDFWRLMLIVRFPFGCVFLALLPIAVFSLVQ
jgi:hypothetical protein